MRRLPIFPALAAAALGAGCSDALGPHADGRVAVAFSTVATSAAPAALAARSVEVGGERGVLVLDELFLIVAEFELDRVDDDACPDAVDDDDCDEFEAPPAFLDVPLDGGTVVAATFDAPPGIYDALEFEVEDLDDDEEDPEEAARIAALMTEIRARFPEWPRNASMMVTGSFTPAGGEPRPFRAFFEAEVEVEMDLVPPVVLGEGASTFTVELDPSRWFVDGGGRVLDLSRFDYDATGRVIELEVEIEDGFVSVEVDAD